MFSDRQIEEAIDYTIALEGGDRYTNDPKDPGRETRFGISKRYNPDVDVRNLTKDLALGIFRSRYWMPHQLERFNYLPFAWKVFDIAVTQGNASAKLALIKVSGWDTPEAVVGLARLQALHYADAVIKSPGKLVYLRGWINRSLILGKALERSAS
jgi:lysozyme family protein